MKKKINSRLVLVVLIVVIVAVIGFGFGLIQLNKQQSQEIKFSARTEKSGFQILKKGKWEDFFVKGVNIGAALPGQWFTEFPKDTATYTGWFEKIAQMNANSIRIYTLLPAEFYVALDDYNTKHPKAVLWLIQEIWPEENPADQNYLQTAYVAEYFKEIEHVVDAIHGKAIIPKRIGRAYGVYTRDVSKYVLGYLVGRELEPDEVIATNEKNKAYSYKGEYLASELGASASEAWLAMNCDYVLKYEEEKYKWQHPVAIVSWPTLDVQVHDSEWNTAGLKALEYNDKISIDINHIDTGTKMKAGFFGAYHIYPNYPDFMNNENTYNNYNDEKGRLRYGGYLQEFIKGHNKYPALVAEFGLPTGMGNAHTSPDGLNHGGLTEEQQGEGIVRMMQAINKEGYAGGLIFEWMDEWAKKTWVTEPYMIPYDRHVFWHNALDPEQNYGLLAMESTMPKGEEVTEKGNGQIKGITINHDATFLYLDINLGQVPDFKKEKLLIGVDTYDRSKGEFKFIQNSDIVAPTGLEFLLDINGEQNSKILVQPGYNAINNKFSSYASSKGLFEEMRLLTSKARITKDGRNIEAIYQDESKLNYGKFEANSYYHWYVEGDMIRVRIPWGKLNVTDPSTLTVLDDSITTGELARDKLKTVKTEGILVSVLLYNTVANVKLDSFSTKNPYAWKSWETPVYTERLKKSYYIVQDYFGKLN